MNTTPIDDAQRAIITEAAYRAGSDGCGGPTVGPPLTLAEAKALATEKLVERGIARGEAEIEAAKIAAEAVEAAAAAEYTDEQHEAFAAAVRAFDALVLAIPEEDAGALLVDVGEWSLAYGGPGGGEAS